MRVLLVSSLLIANLFAASECKEIEYELKRLENLRQLIEKKIERNKELLTQIETERKKLEELQKAIENERKEIAKKRYKKLAKDFEGMDPEYAGEKLSKMDPKIAAYILFNMNSRKAGEALNYVDSSMVNEIAKILTELKKHEK
jgi:flagellar motility protein MotE (MotC chaperone)